MGACPPAASCPAALVTRDQWVAWRIQERNGKETKVPVNPATGNYASATDSETWADFATAREHATASANGVGFVFTEDDPLVGVDLDDCRDPDDGSLTDWAKDIVERVDSFTEVSPSGTGLHVLVKGELPEGRNRHGDVELYDDARFFTVTGDHESGTPETVEARQDALEAVHAEYVAQDEATDATDDQDDSAGAERAADTQTERSTGPPEQSQGNDLSDDALLERARNASNSEKFQRLWRGNTAGYPSQSEADMALCSLLAFWTGGDPEQIDRLFRDSALMRPKWDEQHFADGATYGEQTIERAIAGTDEFYTTSVSKPAGTATPAGATRDDTESGTAPPAATADQQSGVPVRVVEELETELQRLQTENEALRDELAAERKRREELEAMVEAGEENAAGWWTRLRSRFF
jgi:primase-polymerase (primpol)-like protein